MADLRDHQNMVQNSILNEGAMVRIFSSLVALLGMIGCRPDAPSAPRTIKDVIESYKDAPIGKSLRDVARTLARCEVLIPTEGVAEPGPNLKLKVGHDNQGRSWAYMYTDEAELLEAFPNGCPYVAMAFPDAFAIVANDESFGGIFINRTDKYKYLIPLEVFDSVKSELDSAMTPGSPKTD